MRNNLLAVRLNLMGGNQAKKTALDFFLNGTTQ